MRKFILDVTLSFMDVFFVYFMLGLIGGYFPQITKFCLNQSVTVIVHLVAYELTRRQTKKMGWF